MTPTNREIAEHILACYDTIYIVLGESAPSSTNDAYVVRTYEMARAYGDLALELRRYLGGGDVAPIAVLEGVLRDAASGDGTVQRRLRGLCQRDSSDRRGRQGPGAH